MIFVVGIEIKGAALRDADTGSHELADMLRELADRVKDGGNWFPLKDVNGNTVGGAEFRMSGTLTDVGMQPSA